jgi:recombination protein RecA
MNLEEKKKALATTLKVIEKEEGKGSVMVLGDSPIVQVPVIPTGSLALDVALGTGGMPKGRIIEAYGPEASGKTTLGLHMVSEAQRAGGLAAYIDMEHSLDLAYARALGVKTDELILSQPNSGDSGMRIMDKLTRSGTVDIIVIDSVSALVPIEELEGEITDNHVGRQARMMSQGLRIIAGRASKTGTMIYFINQLRMKIGVMFGNPETTSGGNALKFYASVRLDIRRKGPIKEGKDDFIGAKTKVKIVKNKLAPPFKTCFFDILYGKGIDKLGDIIELGPQYDVLQKSGAWYSWGGENVGQGSENTKNWLRENPVIAETLYTEIMMRALPARFVQAEEATKEAVEEVEAVVDTD